MWPFRRKPKPADPAPVSPPHPIADRRFMNEDWKVGDIAECMTDDWPRNGKPHPRKGDRLRVTRIIENVGTLGYLCYGLCFEEKAAHLSWECVCFRKLRLTIEPATDEFTAELRDRLKIGEPA